MWEIITGNSSDVLSGLPSNHVNLTVTSPPYDNLREYKGYSFPFEAIAKQLYRVTKPGGVVVWVVADATSGGSETGTSFKQALFFKECGFNLHDTMIYASEKPPLTHNRYEQKFEYMFVFSKGKPATFNPIMEECKHAGKSGSKRTFRHEGSDLGVLHQADKPIKDFKIKGNVWWYATGASTAEKEVFKHPATYPEKLAEDHILSWSKPGDLVLDPFHGSGTTGKMAVKNARNFLGIEISPEYSELSRKRISASLPADFLADL